MQYSELGHWLKKSAQWVDDYYQKLAHRPIRPSQSPGEFAALLPASPPQKAEPVGDIMADFERLVLLIG